jgi:hypothetical protein
MATSRISTDNLQMARSVTKNKNRGGDVWKTSLENTAFLKNIAP